MAYYRQGGSMDGLGMFQPQVKPQLGGEIVPAALMGRAAKVAAQENDTHLAIALERPDGSVSRQAIPLFPPAHPLTNVNPLLAERAFKFFLWQRGGYKAVCGGPGGDRKAHPKALLLRRG